MTYWKEVKAAGRLLRILRTVESCSAARDVGAPFYLPRLGGARGVGGGRGRRRGERRWACGEPLGGSKMECSERGGWGGGGWVVGGFRKGRGWEWGRGAFREGVFLTRRFINGGTGCSAGAE